MPGARAAASIDAGGKRRDNALRVAPNLDLYCDPEGRRRWTFDFVSPVTGKRRYAGFGPFPEVALAQARAKGEEFRKLIDAGRDPLDERAKNIEAGKAEKAATALNDRRTAATVRVQARAVHKSIAAGFRNKKHAAQWLSSIENSLPKSILDKPVADVQTDELLDVMIDLYTNKRPTGTRVRQRLEHVFADAALRGLCDRNPAALIEPRLRKVGDSGKVSSRSLPYARVPDFVARLRSFERADAMTRLVFELLVLAAARSGEVRGARWSEFDVDAKL